MIPGTALFICGSCSLGMRPEGREKPVIRRFRDDADSEIQIGEIRVICGSPWPCGCRSKWRTVKRVCLMRFVSTHNTKRSRPKPAPARLYARTAPGAGPRPCRRCAPSFEEAHRSRKCASWKSPEIPSKVRTLLQDAHQKLSAFENEMEV